jgi:hypothetical protein
MLPLIETILFTTTNEPITPLANDAAKPAARAMRRKGFEVRAEKKCIRG